LALQPLPSKQQRDGRGYGELNTNDRPSPAVMAVYGSLAGFVGVFGCTLLRHIIGTTEILAFGEL